MDTERINAAVKIRIALDRLKQKEARLKADLLRLTDRLNFEDYTEYTKRVQ